jgi:ureidoglycolate dehydrogenase (NAD+)
MNNKSDPLLISKRALASWIQIVLERIGVPNNNALEVAESLVQTSLWGIDSHGIAGFHIILTD